MAILNQGTELEDATGLIGPWAYNTTGGAPRTGFGRGSMNVNATDASSVQPYPFGSTKTTVGAAASFYYAGSSSSPWIQNSLPFFFFTSGGTNVLALQTTVTTAVIKLVKWNGASFDVLATGAAPATNTAIRFDVYVENYGAGDTTERCRVWLRYPLSAAPAVLWIDYQGDLTSPGITSLDGALLTPVAATAASTAGLSEIVIADEPTLRMAVPPIYPNGAGDTNTWDHGAYTDVDELAASTTDYMESGTTGQLFLCNVTDLPTGSFTPLALKVTILAALGSTGPTKIKIAIKTHSTVYYSGEFTLDAVYLPYSFTWLVNPFTTAIWTQAEITALQIGYESVT
jgi:hypothetical protein